MQKFHFWMATGEVVVATEVNGQPEQGTTTVNQVVKTIDKAVTVAHLSNTQVAMQQQVSDRLGGQPMEVLNVTFSAISYLGEMTDEEFFGKAAVEAAAQREAMEAEQVAEEKTDSSVSVGGSASNVTSIFDADTQTI